MANARSYCEQDHDAYHIDVIPWLKIIPFVTPFGLHCDIL